jgi:NAD(P)-dependent dehydrogenase (short-subunit alcohol dehydrogenase family)
MRRFAAVNAPNIHATRHQGKIALVTGGSSGIGLATAQRLAREGATVVITGRRQPELDAAVRTIGHGAVGVRGDIGNLEDLDRLLTTIKERFARLDILFANAGSGRLAPLGAITEEHVDETYRVNVKGTLFTVQKALPLMPDESAIVINGSMAASKGMPAFSVYAATKAALRSFARGWTTDLKARRIRVNVVAPGTIITPGYKTGGLSDAQIEGFKAMASAAAPLGRTGTEDDVAKAVSFLASDDASYITGIELFVDGGTAQI